MSNSKNTANQTIIQDGREVEVLYQKMGDRWFAFSLIDDEVFVGSISPDELNQAEAAEGVETSVHRKPGRA